MANTPGTLWVVATPIGNLEDLSPRAQRILGAVAQVVCEDTRHSGRLLAAFGIRQRLASLHEHNEARVAPGLVERLAAGESMALISDAGTPLLSDPGYRLVRAAAEAGVTVSPVPGPSALLAALSVAGLATDRCAFEGFLPAKAAARRARLQALAEEPRTMVFFEAGNRVAALLQDAVASLGAGREAVLARELTKLHEQVYRGKLEQLVELAGSDPDVSRGEMVVLVAGRGDVPAGEGDHALLHKLLPALLEELPPSRAVKLAAKLSGVPRRAVYELALSLGASGVQ